MVKMAFTRAVTFSQETSDKSLDSRRGPPLAGDRLEKRQDREGAKLPLVTADGLLHMPFFAIDREIQHRKPTQHDGDG